MFIRYCINARVVDLTASLLDSFERRCDTRGEEKALKCVATDEFCLDNGILHGMIRGIGLDSTWRNMSQNFAPLTFMVTQTAEGRMVPGTWHLCPGVRAND